MIENNAKGEKGPDKRGLRSWRTLTAKLRDLGNKEPSEILELDLDERLPFGPLFVSI